MTPLQRTAAGREAVFGPPAALTGVVPYRGELAQRGYRLNRFLVQISQHQNRQAYLDDEEAAMASAQLAPAERDMVRQRDYNAMLAHGVNIYALAKAGYVFGHSLLEIGRGMREAGARREHA